MFTFCIIAAIIQAVGYVMIAVMGIILLSEIYYNPLKEKWYDRVDRFDLRFVRGRNVTLVQAKSSIPVLRSFVNWKESEALLMFDYEAPKK